MRKILLVIGGFFVGFGLGGIVPDLKKTSPNLSPNFIAVVNEDDTEIEYYFPTNVHRVTINLK